MTDRSRRLSPVLKYELPAWIRRGIAFMVPERAGLASVPQFDPILMQVP